MAETARQVAGAVLMLAGTGLICLMALLDFTRCPRTRWFHRPLVLLPLAAACMLLGVLVAR